MEVDFLIVKDQKPLALFKAKETDLEPTRAGSYFQKQLQIPYFQIVNHFDGVEAWPDQRYIVSSSHLLSFFGKKESYRERIKATRWPLLCRLSVANKNK